MAGPSRRVRLSVSLYLVLLGLSCVVRTSRPSSSPPGDTEKTLTVNAVANGIVTGRRVRVAYRDYTAGGPRAPVVVLIHGSPGRKEDFDRLAPLLAPRYRVIVPDLPGFGASDRNLPDYSFRAHAVYISQLLDQLGIQRVHVVGYSMGGGVALSFVDIAPMQVASLTMLSAIGVQEMELTGDYYVNHAVHAAQLGALWLVREGTPHFGALDDAMLGVPYARNFLDSDQRPLRNILRRVTVPTLILHGVDDGQVPVDAAREHARLAPQSELVVLESNHFLPFAQAPLLDRYLSQFVDRVESGTAPDRTRAAEERIRASIPLSVSAGPPMARGIAALVFGLLLTATSMASRSVGIASAGGLVGLGRVSAMLGWSASFVGIASVEVLLWFRQGANRRRTSGSIVVESFYRLTPFVRSAPAVSLCAITAALTAWSIAVVALVARAVLRIVPAAASSSAYIPKVLAVSIAAQLIRIAASAATYRGRRLLVSAWRRLTRWEFWPPWVFYPPLLVYVAYLMVKHRSLTCFTAANPAIVAGGFLGESKFAILEGLTGAKEFVARSSLIAGHFTGGEKFRQARQFMQHASLTFPIVVKPNQGQRGSGVVVVRSAEVLSDVLARSSVDTIVQEYIPGREFGVFYYRYPTESSGHIFSVTEKRFPTVVADGTRTLEQLILDDDRAVCAARLYCDQHRDELFTIPPAGDVIPLVELGTHCRGAMFLNGDWIVTPALAQQFDWVAKQFEGFYFGRFDVRVDGALEEFRAGRGFKILELNGVTSEATHIYHPFTPLTTAYRVLMEQWRIAFEIGAENERRGCRPTPLHTLIGLVLEYRRTARRHLNQSSGRAAAPRRVNLDEVSHRALQG